MKKKQSIYIHNFQGIIGDVDTIGNMVTGNNSHGIFLQQQTTQSEVTNKKILDQDLTLTTCLPEKFTIQLNEKNDIPDSNKLLEQIDLIIDRLLDDKAIDIILTSLKYQKEYAENSSMEVKNFFKREIKSNNEKLTKVSKILNTFLPYAIQNRLFEIGSFRIIFLGLIDRIGFYTRSLTAYTRIDLYNRELKFGTYIHLSENELNPLKDNFEKHTGLSFNNFIDSGYDIYDLPTNIRFSKAIPAILEEFFYRDYSINDIRKYLSLKIGLG